MVYINKHKYEESTDIDETLIETIIFVFIKMQTHLQPFSLDNSLWYMYDEAHYDVHINAIEFDV